MSFVYPSFLYAFLVLLFPIIIHLFNFRKYKKVLFSKTSLLLEIKSNTNKTRRIVEWLILTVRCLLLSFLILAFAQPYFSEDILKVTTDKKVIVIDNSFSMQASNSDGVFFSQAKEAALKMITSNDKTIQYKVVTTDLNSKNYYWLNYKEAVAKIEGLTYSAITNSFAAIQAYVLANLDSKEIKPIQVFFFSDFQKATFSNYSSEKTTKLSYVFIPFKLNPELFNVSIDSCWRENYTAQVYDKQEVFVKITNHNSSTKKIPLKLIVDGKQSGQKMVEVAPKETLTTSFSFLLQKQGVYKLIVSTSTEDNLSFDNQYYYTFKTTEGVKATVVSDKNDNANLFRKIATTDTSLVHLNYCTSSNLNYGYLKSSNLIILNQLKSISEPLLSFLSIQDANLVIIPNKLIDIDSYKKLSDKININAITVLDTTNLIAMLDANQEFFQQMLYKEKDEQLRLFNVANHYRISKETISGKYVLMNFNNNEPLLVEYIATNNINYLFSIGLTEYFSGFSKHKIILPIFFQIFLRSGFYKNATYPIKSYLDMDYEGEDQIVNLINDKGEELQTAYSKNNNLKLALNQVTQAGFYNLSGDNGFNQLVAFNYSRLESHQEVLLPKLETNNSEHSKIETISSVDYLSSSNLWKYCLYIALGLLVLEIILIKYNSKKYAKRVIN